ncbi:hypothetical protein BJV77DRAFT_1061146 [Russula vinacea]|nr:hypothetical protein BJV77DRAFT_1061146 [Russula vinacea]
MVSPRTPTSSNSSALFESDDTFLEALVGVVLPGDSRYKKRAYSVSSDDEHPALAHSPVHAPDNSGTGSYMDSDAYGASRFGGFGEYMRRKRAKLQIQNTEMGGTTTTVINGWTEPSVQELRKLIVDYGGVYHAYIDKKTLHTHYYVLPYSRKVREFKHMKVVRPEWLVQSVKAGVLLPWQDFIFVTGGRHRELGSPDRTPFPRQDSFHATPSSAISSNTIPCLVTTRTSNPAWRAEHTSMAPGFIAGYYANSRLHHLSTWKAELRTLVTEAQEHAERGDVHKVLESTEGVSMRNAALVMKNPLKGKEKASSTTEQVIMHVDFDAFFVSAGLVSRPHLRGKPVVVCHSQHAQGGASSTSEIASASYEARGFGIKNGMSLQQARKLCPDTYRELSLKFYTILMSCADDLQAVSVDEALIDSKVVPTGMDEENDCTSTDIAKELAEDMRTQIKATTGCEGTQVLESHQISCCTPSHRRAKPAGSFYLRPAAFMDLLPTLDIQDLHGFGRAAREKACEKLGTSNLGELARRSKAGLCDALGKSMGETLYNAVRGVDERKLESDKPRKSVSCDINYGIRFENNDQVEAFIHQMSEEVARRLDAIGVKGRSLTLKIMKRDPSAPVEAPKFMGHGQCITYNKQSALADSDGHATSDPRLIGEVSWRLLRVLNIAPKELRGMSIQIQKLDAPTGCAPTHGQARLPFRSKPNSTAASTSMGHASNARASSSGLVTVQPDPEAPTKGMDLPSFSQIDMSVYEALPEDIRQELEAEYQRRRSAPPRPEPEPAVVVPELPRRAASAHPPRGGNRNYNSRHKQRPWWWWRTSTAPPPIIPPAAAAVRVKPGELAELGIDEEVFAALPVRIQREQLAAARGARGAEVRKVVRAWVERFVGYAPHAEDVALVGSYLVRCVETDVGAERAVGVMRWWGALLRRRWAVWEHADERDEEPEPGEDVRAEMVGMAWWRAYREVASGMNEVVRKRFGGGSLKFR